MPDVYAGILCRKRAIPFYHAASSNVTIPYHAYARCGFRHNISKKTHALHMPIIIAACPRLESPTYGDTSIDGCNVGDTATTTCDKGYKVTGSAVRYCSSNGWLGTDADCVPVSK